MDPEGLKRDVNIISKLRNERIFVLPSAFFFLGGVLSGRPKKSVAGCQKQIKRYIYIKNKMKKSQGNALTQPTKSI